MSVRGEISELEEGTGFYKLKYNFRDMTRYELQNRSNKPLTVTFTFFDVENLSIVSERGTVEGDKVTLRVKPGETTQFVDLVTKDAEQGWHYNYDPEWTAEETPAWL
eukprot:TRINITY_DN22826_c0_g1_i1.p2 TRINITY_DN22826_c0_g1~~TRINITY_DN22826_c0_g1_i1.p2  ORF type:complete len:107 (+),score=44.46 TRINITY_DN22826_c0_g1_i1:55-375(+)